jgi:hypothetical protein
LKGIEGTLSLVKVTQSGFCENKITFIGVILHWASENYDTLFEVKNIWTL